MRLAVDAVIIGCRRREDLGDIEGLAASMQALGQLCPILVDTDNRLLAGERRLTAAKRLGWTSIEAVVYDRLCPELTRRRIELDENEARKPFTTEERILLAADIEEAERVLARERQAHGQTAPGKTLRQPVGEAFGKAADLAASTVGMSGETLRTGKRVLEGIATLRENGNHITADVVRGTLNAKGIKPALRLLEDTAKPGLPAAVDDRAIVRRMVQGVVANLTSLDLLVRFDPNDVVDDTEAATLVAFAEWMARRAQKPKLRVVPCPGNIDPRA